MAKTLTELIRDCKDGVIDNPYQGKDRKVLFVCSAGILRSATAARIYADKYNTRACGSMVDLALVPISVKLMAWADEIVFVNKENYLMAMEEFGEDMPEDKIKVLNIPDQHAHKSAELIQAFKDQYEDF